MKLPTTLTLFVAIVATVVSIDIYRALQQNVELNRQLQAQTETLVKLQQAQGGVDKQLNAINKLFDDVELVDDVELNVPEDLLVEEQNTHKGPSDLPGQIADIHQKIQQISKRLQNVQAANKALTQDMLNGQTDLAKLTSDKGILLMERNQAYITISNILGQEKDAIRSQEDFTRLVHKHLLSEQLQQRYCAEINRLYLQEVNKVSACQWGNLQSVMDDQSSPAKTDSQNATKATQSGEDEKNPEH